jgi:hypothetical protein
LFGEPAEDNLPTRQAGDFLKTEINGNSGFSPSAFRYEDRA